VVSHGHSPPQYLATVRSGPYLTTSRAKGSHRNIGSWEFDLVLNLKTLAAVQSGNAGRVEGIRRLAARTSSKVRGLSGGELGAALSRLAFAGF
jgi:hypothetical protein